MMLDDDIVTARTKARGSSRAKKTKPGRRESGCLTTKRVLQRAMN
jgi:hypothetical protein